MINDIIILDDFISEQYQDEIEKGLLGDTRIPWYLQDDVTMGFKDLPYKNTGMSHVLKNDHGITSNLYHFVMPMVYEAFNKIDYVVDGVILARSFLQLPALNNNPNWPHTDINVPHTVCLYYVNDSEGETVIYNETDEDVLVNQIQTYSYTECKRIAPKKGRVAIFNGNRFHASGKPTSKKRCILNFDLNVRKR